MAGAKQPVAFIDREFLCLGNACLEGLEGDDLVPIQGRDFPLLAQQHQPIGGEAAMNQLMYLQRVGIGRDVQQCLQARPIRAIGRSAQYFGKHGAPHHRSAYADQYVAFAEYINRCPFPLIQPCQYPGACACRR
ncbi:hypothetical protein D3C86_1782610 [compost metagenome]